jgi:RNAse (barnase) inhibitor barstar
MMIDVTECETKEAVHETFKQDIKFPDFYGANWVAFLAAITGLVEMPDAVLLHYRHAHYRFQVGNEHHGAAVGMIHGRRHYGRANHLPGVWN